MLSPTQPSLDCTAVLLAGGASTRMGRDKAWLDFHGRPLWQAQVEKLAFARDIFISARAETFPEKRPGFRVVLDGTPGKGPLGGLQAALRAARFERVICLAVDMPEMTAEYLHGLALEATDEVGVVPEVDGLHEGLAAVYPKRILPVVEEILRGQDFSLQSLCGESLARGLMETRRVSPEEVHLFRNWNRPEDVL